MFSFFSLVYGDFLSDVWISLFLCFLIWKTSSLRFRSRYSLPKKVTWDLQTGVDNMKRFCSRKVLQLFSIFFLLQKCTQRLFSLEN